MVFFGYTAKGRFTPDLSLHVVGPRRQAQALAVVPRPTRMVHDFVVTRDWIILPIFPLTGSMERAMRGLPPFAWEPDKGTHIALMPRRRHGGSACAGSAPTRAMCSTR